MKKYLPQHRITQTVVLLILLFCVWRGVLQVLAWRSDSFFPYNPTFPYAYTLLPQFSPYRSLYSWANFDGVHYITIIQKGYQGTALIQAFFPAYPLLVVAIDSVLPFSALTSGLLVSHFSLLLSLMVLWKLLNTINAPQVVRIRTALLLLAFPTSFFFISFYTESLFLLSVLLVFWCAHKKLWWGVALAGIVASATRVVGIAAVVGVLCEFFLQNRKHMGWKEARILMLCALGSLGLVAYMTYLWMVFKDPLYFLHVQSEFGAGRQETIILLPQVLWRGVKILLYSDMNWRWWTSLQELIFTIVFGCTLVFGYNKYKEVPLSWYIFSALCLLIPTTTGTLSSMPRYLIVLFPVLYIWASARLSLPKWVLIFTMFIVGLVLNTLLFLQGYWVA